MSALDACMNIARHTMARSAQLVRHAFGRTADSGPAAAKASTSLDAALSRIRDKPVDVSSMISIGAGRGLEMELLRKLWPGANALLIDMDERFVKGWKRLEADFPGLRYCVCAAGARDSTGVYQKTDLVGGALSSDSSSPGQKTVIRSVDSLVREFGMRPPFFLKFDTHGAELDILEGARETLKQTSLVMMEVYNFKLNFMQGRNLTFDEMSLHMKSLGFRCVDLCDPLFRPKDGALWQFHMFFIKDSHPVWLSSGYR